MKTTIQIVFLTTILTYNIIAQGIGINAIGVTPDPSALLDLRATDKGFLITRVDTANISSPAFGLMTLAPLDSCLYMYSGLNWISIGGVGNNCPCNCASSTPTTILACGVNTVIEDVTSPTGKTWMDRNLGATQIAASSSDAASYGCLYQWGRSSDGHEDRNSVTTSTLSTTDTPGHGNFIEAPNAPNDWRSPKNDNLWQGVSGINNPCPTGYRIPTEAEFQSERDSWTSFDTTGAFDSPLKLPIAGRRDHGTNAILLDLGSKAYYWSSTVNGVNARYFFFSSSDAGMYNYYRAFGHSVRCIKN